MKKHPDNINKYVFKKIRIGFEPSYVTLPTNFLYIANVPKHFNTKKIIQMVKMVLEQIKEHVNEKIMITDILEHFSSKDVQYIDGNSYTYIYIYHNKVAELLLNALKGYKLESDKLYKLFASYATVPPDKLDPHRSIVETTKDLSSIELPEGLYLIRDFVTSKEENELLKYIDSLPWLDYIRRRVQHYGFTFQYGSNSIDVNSPIEPIPSYFNSLKSSIEQTASKKYHSPLSIDQLTINEYLAGEGIKSHIDTHHAFTEYIISLSLGSHTVFKMKHQDKELHIYLPPRTLLIMCDKARYCWTHGINGRKGDLVDNVYQPRKRRVSLTFRQVKKDQQCTCSYLNYCSTPKR